jgi:hypothetical protein
MTNQLVVHNQSVQDMTQMAQALVDAYGDSDTLLMAQVKAALDKAKGEAK